MQAIRRTWADLVLLALLSVASSACLIQAALLSDPDEAQGMVGAPQKLAEELSASGFGCYRSVSSLMLSTC